MWFFTLVTSGSHISFKRKKTASATEPILWQNHFVVYLILSCTESRKSRENQYRTPYLCFISSIRHAMSLPSNELNYTSSTQWVPQGGSGTAFSVNPSSKHSFNLQEVLQVHMDAIGFLGCKCPSAKSCQASHQPAPPAPPPNPLSTQPVFVHAMCWNFLS